MKRSEMAKILTYIMSDFDAAPSADKVSVWYDQCKHLDAEFAMDCARALMREGHFGVPRVADFLRIVEHATKPASERITAGEAWQLVLEQVRVYGAARASAAALALKEHPRIINVVRQLGWHRVCMADTKELPFLEKRFIEAYTEVKERDSLDRQVAGAPADPRVQQIAGQVAGMIGFEVGDVSENRDPSKK